MPKMPSSAAMTTSGRQWQSGRSAMWLSCSTAWTAAWRRLRGRVLVLASSEGSWSSCCSEGIWSSGCCLLAVFQRSRQRVLYVRKRWTSVFLGVDKGPSEQADQPVESALGVCPSGLAVSRAHDMTLIPLYVQRQAMWPEYQHCMLL